MCGIIVSASTQKDILTYQDTMSKRGPDQWKTVVRNNITFSFHRLAIMDLKESGMQPFEDGGNILVANGEIYNYRDIQKQFRHQSFKGKSDCEVLLPLYRMMGKEMFSHLDAEFAIVLYNSNQNQLIAARDPIGIRPLFYGYHKIDGKILFASEAKAIIGVVDKAFPFPPGHMYVNQTFVQFHSLYDIKSYYTHDLTEITLNIKHKLTQGVFKRLDSDAPMGFLLSGGLDSSLVCSIASRSLTTPIRTFSIGMATDPIDLKYARTVATYLNTDHTEITMTASDVIKVLPEVIQALESFDVTTIRASIGMYLLAKYIHENTDIKVLHTGEVSDELFGYKYTDFAPSEFAFQEESLKRMKELYMYDVLRADRCLGANSLEARVPFADLNFVDYVLRIDPMYKVNTYNTGKYLLRKAFENGYLPDSILYRDKAAFSDAVGHSMVDTLKEYADKLYDETEFHEQKIKYTPTPISKEALLYRELFEQYYPDHGHLILDYWMPNNSWEGCDVNDPSARVLSNYGDSGI